MRTLAALAILAWAIDAAAWVGTLELKRVIVFGESGIDIDTGAFGGVPRGTLLLEVDGRTLENTAMRFDAAVDDVVLLSRNGIAVGYAGGGGLYEFYAPVSGELFEVHFMRRELSEDSYDPAVLFVVETDDGRQAWLDYRHTK